MMGELSSGQERLFYSFVLALEVDRFSLQHPAPDGEKFIGGHVALIVLEVHTLGGQGWITRRTAHRPADVGNEHYVAL